MHHSLICLVFTLVLKLYILFLCIFVAATDSTKLEENSIDVVKVPEGLQLFDYIMKDVCL